MPNNSRKKRRHIIKPSRLIFLIVLLAANSFAWFIYATRINTDVSVHVRAWNVIFESGDTEISNQNNESSFFSRIPLNFEIDFNS